MAKARKKKVKFRYKGKTYTAVARRGFDENEFKRVWLITIYNSRGKIVGDYQAYKSSQKEAIAKAIELFKVGVPLSLIAEWY